MKILSKITYYLGINLSISGDVVNPSDGDFWYNSILKKFRGRRDGSNKDFLMEGVIIDNGTEVGIGTSSPSEKLDVNGNIKALQVKDQYGTLKSQRVITITGNITLLEVHNGAILHITNTCNITIPTGLGADFSCDCYVKGAFIATFVNSGVTLNSPSGLRLKTDKMCTLYSNASDMFNLLGELATS